MEILTENARETQKFGEKFANNLKGGEVVALVGELGSGKTTFVQGLARGLGIKNRIISPTFILRRDYEVNIKYQKSNIKNLCHIDLYRLEQNIDQEFKKLGLKEIFNKRDSIVVIEWAERVRELLPRSTIWVTFENLGAGKRKIKIGL